jgi:hypothetical protein
MSPHRNPGLRMQPPRGARRRSGPEGRATEQVPAPLIRASPLQLRLGRITAPDSSQPHDTGDGRAERALRPGHPLPVAERDHVRPRRRRGHQEGGEVRGLREGVDGAAHHVAAVGAHDARRLPLHGVAEGVVGGDAVEAPRARLGQRAGGGPGLRPAVGVPVHRVRAALWPGHVGRGGATVDVRLVLLPRQHVQREGDAAVAHLRDGVHAVAVEPLAGDVQADIGLVLVVRLQDLDVQAVGDGEVLHGLAGGGDAAGPADVPVGAGHVAQHADADRGLLRRGGPDAPEY